MSTRYELPGKEPRYHIRVGWDNTMPTIPSPKLNTLLPGTLFAHVEDTEWEQSTSDDEGEEGLLVWVGQGLDDVILDVQELVKAVSPYGNIPLVTQMNLLRDMEQDLSRSPDQVGAALAAICQQSPLARLSHASEEGKLTYLFLDKHGWQVRDWSSLLTQGVDYEKTFADMIYAAEDDRTQHDYAEPLTSYLRDPSIILRVHPLGFSSQKPVFAMLGRGVMLSGPVIIACEERGLSKDQVQQIAQEVFFVDETLRSEATSLWYRSWQTYGGGLSGTGVVPLF